MYRPVHLKLKHTANTPSICKLQLVSMANGRLGHIHSVMTMLLYSASMVFALGSFSTSQAQKNTSIFTSLNIVSPLNAGSFYPGKQGGSVTVTVNGVRESQGSVVLLHGADMIGAAVLEIRTGAYQMVHIQLEQSITMSSSSGGNLHLLAGPLSTGPNFVAPANAEQGFLIQIGAKIIVGSARSCPPGNYSGSFAITIICE